MEDTNNQIALRYSDSELVLDEPPATVTMLLGGNSEKAERLAEHRLQMALQDKLTLLNLLVFIMTVIPG